MFGSLFNWAAAAPRFAVEPDVCSISDSVGAAACGDQHLVSVVYFTTVISYGCFLCRRKRGTGTPVQKLFDMVDINGDGGPVPVSAISCNMFFFCRRVSN